MGGNGCRNVFDCTYIGHVCNTTIPAAGGTGCFWLAGGGSSVNYPNPPTAFFPGGIGGGGNGRIVDSCADASGNVNTGGGGGSGGGVS